MDSQETTVYLTLLTAGLIFGVVVIFFLVTIVRYQRQGVQAYLNRMKADLDLLENERAQLGLDLHDELGSQLAAVQLIVNEIVTNPIDASLLVDKLTGLIQNMRLSIRQLSNSMVSYSLQREGLETGLNELLGNLFQTSSVRATLEWKLQSLVFSQEAEIHVYRIIQELLTNVVKHTEATRVTVTLTRTGTRVVLSVSDNGRSFDQVRIRKSSPGLGLRNVSARVKVLGGRIHLSTDSDTGTAYEITLPVEKLIR